MAKTNVAVLFGGRSNEHAISCVSAGNVMAAIDRTKYNVIPIGITTDGKWLLQRDIANLQISDGRLPEITSGDALNVTSVPGSAITGSDLLSSIDVVFPLLHGPWGEDGTIQGFLELAAIPYVGSGVYASAASMDKLHMKAAFRAAGLPVGDYAAVLPRDWDMHADDVLARLRELPLPLFVKPARAGSSVGITKVKRYDELRPAINEARRHDPKVIVEAGIEGAREIECAVLVGRDGVARASVLGEIKVDAAHEFYDFDAKYIADGADLIVPADLPPAITTAVQDVALAAFAALDCEGLARVDFFVRDTGEVLLNEVNTMPGFTPISMYPRLWAATGVSYAELIDVLITDAVRRGTGLR